MNRLPVAILGCTGAVGQKFVALLADHPWFEVRQLSASTERIGLRYGDTVRWREPTPIPPQVADLVLGATEPAAGVRIAFSALDATVARNVEPAFAAAGVMVVSNASAFRMAADVPLLIPEVNPEHLSLLDTQRNARGWSGGIVANPNCSTAALVTALAPIHRSFGIETAVAATLQAASGAGYPGVPSLDLIDNVIPYIGGEEEKIEAECRKLLGRVEGGAVSDAFLTVSSMVHRVPVLDGHMVSVSLRLGKPATPDQVINTLESFRGDETIASLPSSPAQPVEVDRRDDRPQPRLDRDRGRGMAVTVGRVRPCPVNTIRLTVLGHNLIRGAAGAAVQNAELVVAT
ncbi:MAG TPA: aspartate-semialdehyde dehydrogenase, partial [Gemmatimonadales bacterium]|nr:aspartate-semialdehyde dehydrogenase [Gemmatimonadales bacterium]